MSYVVLGFAWPNRFDTSSRSIPASSIRVADVWRRSWTLTFLVISAAFKPRRNVRRNQQGVSGWRGLVVYAVPEPEGLVQKWLPDEDLRPC
jgi:hypothetical protein